MKAGFVLVLMHYGISTEKLIHQLNDVKPKTLIVPASANLDVMLDYWNKPELTRRVIQNNLFGEVRVYFAGDLFKRDSEQYLY
jgi:hypothetical protein